MSERKRIILSGGGTGGHIYPALAVADALKQIDPTIDILFVGAQGRMEMEKVPAAGYPIEGLWISGFQRRLTFDNVLFPFKLVNSMWKAGKILSRYKADLAVGFGGYASGPLLQMAVRRNIKTAIQEQNAFPGATNRLLAGQVDRIFTAYPDMSKYFDPGKTVYTGNPLRGILLDDPPATAESRQYFNLDPAKKTVLVFGGSLGAGILNTSMDSSERLINSRRDVQWIWQTGQYYESKYRNSATAGLNHVKQLTFLDRMDLAYAAADLVVCRAGALTISELSMLGKPAILMPSPHVAEDHQSKNAASLEQVGAAVYMREDNAEHLISEALTLVSNDARLSQLSSQIKLLAKPDAAIDIAKILIQLIENN